MLDLDSPRWATLHHAYGFAGDVPAMLRKLSVHPDGAWDEIFGSVCHQGDVHSAAYAVVPHVVHGAESLAPHDRVMHWAFIGTVTSGGWEGGIPDDLRDDYVQAIRRAGATIRRDLETSSPSRDDAIYLLAALAGCAGAPEGGVLDYLTGDEMPGQCPSCREYLTAEVGKDGKALTWYRDGDPRNNGPGDTKWTPLADVPAGSASVPDVLDPVQGAAWLPALAARSGHPDVAGMILTLCQVAACPCCGHTFPILREFARR